MVTLAQRITELREERGLSRPALAAALGFPRLTVEKFETGRQTPSQEQQDKLAAFFGVSVFYLRGEASDRTRMDDWMDGAFQDVPAQSAPEPRRAPRIVAAAAPQEEESSLFGAFFSSKKFQEQLRGAVLDALRSPEGQELLAKALRREREKG
jgi:transcriptional regulator with XRE-family HTH domain